MMNIYIQNCDFCMLSCANFFSTAFQRTQVSVGAGMVLSLKSYHSLPWPGGSVGWSIIQYTKRLQVQSPVGECTWGNWSMFIKQFLSLSLSLSISSSLSINKRILRWGLIIIITYSHGYPIPKRYKRTGT